MGSYIVSGIIVLVCISTIIIGLKVLRDTRKIQLGEIDEKENDLQKFRPRKL